LRRQPGRGCDEDEASEPAKSRTQAHGYVSRGRGKIETWNDANARRAVCPTG
jgi:hypothetical protein